MKLSKSEEQLMQYIWKLENAFMNELLDQYPEPKPASSTVATLLKRMQDKGYVGYKKMGRSRQYYPLIKKSHYFSKHINSIIEKYFDDSPASFASFFTRETNLTNEQLRELQEIVTKELKNRKQ